eukprot:7107302-Pyramimonas_sp.AAC.1
MSLTGLNPLCVRLSEICSRAWHPSASGWRPFRRSLNVWRPEPSVKPGCRREACSLAAASAASVR